MTEDGPGDMRRNELAPAFFFGTALSFAVLLILFLTGNGLLTQEQGETPKSCLAYLGHCAEVWTAIGTMGLFIATLVLVGVGLYQLVEIREETKRCRTLAAAGRYFYDPIVDKSQRRLSQFRRVWSDPRGYRIDIQVVLNQLDGLAAGIGKGLYDENFIFDTMKDVFAYHIVIHLDPSVVVHFELDVSNFPALTDLDGKWNAYRSYAESKARCRLLARGLAARREWVAAP